MDSAIAKLDKKACDGSVWLGLVARLRVRLGRGGQFW